MTEAFSEDSGPGPGPQASLGPQHGDGSLSLGGGSAPLTILPKQPWAKASQEVALGTGGGAQAVRLEESGHSSDRA